jgi:hypothetical protein
VTPGLKASITSVVIAAAITTLGTGGTAFAATPADSGVGAVAVQNPPPRPPPPPPHRFRMKFRDLHSCQVRAAHDHPGRQADWDCRRGPDRNNPWEYWGR